MIPIFEGYEPKNKRLSRLGRKIRLQIVLNGAISRQMLAEVRKAVGCGNCKHYIASGGRVMGAYLTNCSKVGEKQKKYLTMLESMTKDGKPYVGLQMAYCCQFEEKE